MSKAVGRAWLIADSASDLLVEARVRENCLGHVLVRQQNDAPEFVVHRCLTPFKQSPDQCDMSFVMSFDSCIIDPTCHAGIEPVQPNVKHTFAHIQNDVLWLDGSLFFE